MYNELFSVANSEIFVTDINVRQAHILVKVVATATFRQGKRYDWHLIASGRHVMAMTTGNGTNRAIIVFICTGNDVTSNDDIVVWTSTSCKAITAQQSRQPVSCTVNVDGASVNYIESCINRVNQNLSQQIQNNVRQTTEPKRITNRVCSGKTDDSGWFMAVIIVAVISIVACVFGSKSKSALK